MVKQVGTDDPAADHGSGFPAVAVLGPVRHTGDEVHQQPYGNELQRDHAETISSRISAQPIIAAMLAVDPSSRADESVESSNSLAKRLSRLLPPLDRAMALMSPSVRGTNKAISRATFHRA